MLKRLAILLPLLSLTACGDSADDFRTAVPDADTVALEIPESTAQALTVESSGQALEGQVSDFYRLTRAMTWAVNGSVGGVLRMLDDITDRRPTSLTENQAVWGPHTPMLARNTWRLTVTRVAEGDFEYVLEGQPRGSAEDAPWEVVLSGSHQKAEAGMMRHRHRLGQGGFLIDWDARARLADHDPLLTGTLEVGYHRMADDGETVVECGFAGATDGQSGRQVNAQYRYRQQAGEGGQFGFEVDNDIDGQPALERLTIQSRWQADGAGRADVSAQGGNLTGPASLVDCWDTDFQSRYMWTSFSQAPEHSYGDEATDCAFGPLAQ